MDWLFATKNTASQLNCTIGDHFIDIHIRLGTRASLPDVKWKLCIEFASDDLLCDFDYKISPVLLQLAGLSVDDRCSLLDVAILMLDSLGHMISSNLEVYPRQ